MLGAMTLDDFPIHVRMPVAWGQMDAFGHLNNTQYFRFFEDARIACFERIGVNANMERTGQGPILARTSCVYRQAVTFPDEVVSATRIRDLGDDRFTMDYAIFSERLGLAAHGEGRIVMVDYKSGAKVPIPKAIREAIAAL